MEIIAGTDRAQTYTLVIERRPELMPLPFTDLGETHWAYEAVQFMYGLGIIQGYPDETFRAERPITRAEFIVMLMNMQKLLAQTSAAAGSSEYAFADQDAIGGWAWPAVEQALNEAIVYGYEDGSFRPQAPIQRSEMIAILARTSMFQSLLLEVPEWAPRPFQDAADIPSWAMEAVEDAQRIGMIQGREGHLFAPSASATRGEVAVLMYNFYSIVIESAAYKEN